MDRDVKEVIALVAVAGLGGYALFSGQTDLAGIVIGILGGYLGTNYLKKEPTAEVQ